MLNSILIFISQVVIGKLDASVREVVQCIAGQTERLGSTKSLGMMEDNFYNLKVRVIAKID